MDYGKFDILRPGVHTTIQDGGRHGYRKYGIPVCGYMDHHAAALANWLVGNTENAPLIELIQTGTSILFHHACTIAITGADMQASMNGQALPLYEQISLRANSTVQFSNALRGNIGYMAVGGEILANVVLGSKSTYSPAQWGGMEGRPLKKGDKVNFTPPKKVARRVLPEHYIQQYYEGRKVRFVQGPEWLKTNPLEVFVNQPFTILPQSNRMGIRLNAKSPFQGKLDPIISSPVTPGSIQLPPDGQPIILMADGQTTGGYPRIGTIIHFDLPYLAQQSPGSTIRLEMISIEQAMYLFHFEKNLIKKLFAIHDE